MRQITSATIAPSRAMAPAHTKGIRCPAAVLPVVTARMPPDISSSRTTTRVVKAPSSMATRRPRQPLRWNSHHSGKPNRNRPSDHPVSATTKMRIATIRSEAFTTPVAIVASKSTTMATPRAPMTAPAATARVARRGLVLRLSTFIASFLAIQLGRAFQQLAREGIAGALLLAQLGQADDLVEGSEVQHAVGEGAGVAGGMQVGEEPTQRLGSDVAGRDREGDGGVADLLQPLGGE